MRRLGRGYDFAALADDGRRAGDVIDALKLGGEREGGACPVVGCAAPVVIPKRGKVSARRKQDVNNLPLLRACCVLSVEHVNATLRVHRLRFLVKDASTCE